MTFSLDRRRQLCNRSGHYRRRLLVVFGALSIVLSLRWQPASCLTQLGELLLAGVPPATLLVARGSGDCQIVALASEGISDKELTEALEVWNCNMTGAPKKSRCSRTLGFPHVREKMKQAWKDRSLLIASYNTYEWVLTGQVSEIGKPPSADSIKGSMRRVCMQSHPSDLTNEQLLEFLNKVYGKSGIKQLQVAARSGDNATMIKELKSLFTWFRKEFPYYRGACSVCGTKGEFIGLVRPSDEDEAKGRVSVTELYLCHKQPVNESETENGAEASCPGCLTATVTAFPRYSSVAWPVLQTRRGRCGEYSTLAMQILNAVGIDSRWVNNHAGHVWAEANVAGRWVHIDPCEAAVDTPLIYAKDWGRNPDHVLAYHADHVLVFADAGENVTQQANVAEVTDEYRLEDAPAVSNETRVAVAKAISLALA